MRGEGKVAGFNSKQSRGGLSYKTLSLSHGCLLGFQGVLFQNFNAHTLFQSIDSKSLVMGSRQVFFFFFFKLSRLFLWAIMRTTDRESNMLNSLCSVHPGSDTMHRTLLFKCIPGTVNISLTQELLGLKKLIPYPRLAAV